MSIQTNSTEPAPARELEFPPAAVHFLFDALGVAADSVHGPVTREWQVVADWLRDQELDLVDLPRVFETMREQIPIRVLRSVIRQGGPAAFHRHVSGEELCDGVRVLALRRWGRMAAAVLASWGIESTRDIGRLVFWLIEIGRLQKQPGDSIEEFEDVFDFREVFERGYRIEFSSGSAAHASEG